LGYFKYADLLIASSMQLADHLGFVLDVTLVEVAVPVAISFFTFHAISYLVDVHKNTIKASGSLLDLTLYISFFPHLVAGPIVRAREFLPQLAEAPRRMPIPLGASLALILGGLFKKVVIADTGSTDRTRDIAEAAGAMMSWGPPASWQRGNLMGTQADGVLPRLSQRRFTISMPARSMSLMMSFTRAVR
jgi:D-alanyl-lipoteichoic acid acyltransferase DltB (MBOAT superfamily)